MAGGHIQLQALTKAFADVVAVDALTLEIQPGEFFSLLGPSGCGKTTTLRMVGGFERPTGGLILLDGVDVSNLPPNRRNVNTVFQHYALFPFLNVAENIAFGMRYQRSLSKAEVRRLVGDVLELVHLSGYEKRRPNQLSGGQQQRVALARALVLRPAVLLLDEPLGALDAKIRKQLRLDLKALQEEVGITFLFVTHDQEEGLSMSDRIAVMNAGRIEQIGTPAEVYEDPATVFAADFLGVSNMMDAHASEPGGGRCTVTVGDFKLRAACGDVAGAGPVKLVARPERVTLLEHGAQRDNCLPGMVERTVYVGAIVQVLVRLATGAQLQATLANAGDAVTYEQGTPVSVQIPPEALRVLADSAPESLGIVDAGPEPEAASGSPGRPAGSTASR